MRKNDEIILDIVDVTSEGSGVGKYEGMAVFVPQTAVGDTVRVKILKVQKSYAYGKAQKLISASNTRCDADCVVYEKCGGCVFRHINYEEEKRIKTEIVRNALLRIGGIDVPMGPIMFDRPDGYRNKAQYPINEEGRAGFFAARSHRIVPVDCCRLQPPVFSDIQKAFELFIKQYGISIYNEQTGKGLIRHLYIRSSAGGDVLVTVVINGEKLPHAEPFIEILKTMLGDKLSGVCINVNRQKTNVILGDTCRTLYGKGYIVDTICGVKLRVSPLSFAQVNHDMAQKLYSAAIDAACVEGKTVIDLYCGTGAIGLIAAARAKSVIGVEIVPQAVEDAIKNAAENGIENARFICDDAAGAAARLRDEGVTADVVIVDPPRKGCDSELLSIIANNFSPERIVYVSCDPATLARDLKILSTLGYSVRTATPADLFPRTAHVETVALLEKN